MLEYPSISKEIIRKEEVWALDKLDGVLFRAEWSFKRGFYKFGSKHQMVDLSHENYGQPVKILLEKYSDPLAKAFIDQRYRKAVCFFEYWGRNSFAGIHQPNDEMCLTLFDVAPDKQGLLKVQDFYDLFDHLDVPVVVYRGRIGKEVENTLRHCVGIEGVVCKGRYVAPGYPLMFKIKTHDWLARLKEHCKGDEKLFEELA